MADTTVFVFFDKEAKNPVGTGVKKVELAEGVGRYRIKFSNAFTGKYATVASNTDGFVRIATDTEEDVIVESFDKEGQPRASQISVVVFGKR